MEERKFSSFSVIFSEALLYFYIVVGYLEKIHSLYSVVIVLDAVISAAAFFYVLFWFYLNKEYRSNPVSTALGVLTLTILASSVIGESDGARLSVAAFALIESWAVGIALIILRGRIKEAVIPAYVFILVYCVVYSLLSLHLGFESGEVRYSGLSDQTNSLAVVAASSLLISVSLIGRRKTILQTVILNILLISAALCFAYTLSKTDSRTSFFALLTAVVFFLVMNCLISKDRISLVISSLLVAVTVFLLIVYLLSSSRSEGKMTLSALTSGRTTIWSETLSRMDLENYIFGFGGNSAEMTSLLEERGMSKSLAGYLGKDHLMHNIFLQFLVEYGVFSALSFAFGYIYTFVLSIKILIRKKNLKIVLLPSSVLLLFFFVHTLAESSIYFIGGAEQILFIVSMSVVYSVYRSGEEKK